MVFSKQFNQSNIFAILFLLTSNNFIHSQDVKPTFRILAPQFICSTAKLNGNDSEIIPSSTPGATTIRLQTATGQQLSFNWTVRFNVLNGPRGQRFNLLVWKAVRTLEKKLTEMNSEIAETNMVTINNTMLIEGVNYVFNISGINKEGIVGDTKTFSVKFSDAKSEPKLDLIDGDVNDKFSVVMLGSDIIYADLTYIVEAQVTPCHPTNDYYFDWTVLDLKTNKLVEMGLQRGKRLVIPPNTLMGGRNYDIKCRIMKISTDKKITSHGIYLTTLIKGMSVDMNVDKMKIASNMAISIVAILRNPDNMDGNLSIVWKCKRLIDLANCEKFESINSTELMIERGLEKEGEYEFEVIVAKGPETASKKAIVIIENAMIPTIEFDITPMLAVSGQAVEIQARVFDLRASCNLYWTSVKEKGFEYVDEATVPGGLSRTLSVNSLEETFLSELVEYGNETMHRNFPLLIPGADGNWAGLKPNAKYKFRLKVECSCSVSIECEGPKNVTTFSDVVVETNEPPIPEPIYVKPSVGVALRDVFRFYTKSATDIKKDYPLTYSFAYIESGSDLTIISSYVENSAVETILPYSDEPLIPVLKVCDSRNACSFNYGDPITVTKPNSISPKELQNYLNTFVAQLYRKEYTEAFHVIAMILQTLKAIGSAEEETWFLEEVETVTKMDIANQTIDVNNRLNLIDSNEFVQVSTKFIERFKVSDAFIQDVLKLRDDVFEALSQSSIDKNSSYTRLERCAIEKCFLKYRRYKRDISPSDVKNYIESSEYIISKSENPQQILKEKKNILSKLEISTPDLCKLNQRIIIDWKTLSTSIENVNLKSYMGALPIPYFANIDRKANESNIAEMQLILPNNYLKGSFQCFERSAFSMNYLQDIDDDSRRGWIYHISMLDKNQNRDDGFEIILKIPILNLVIGDQESLQCRRWIDNEWNENTCETNEKFTVLNKITYAVCKCDALGYYSLYIVNRPRTTTTVGSSSITTILEHDITSQAVTIALQIDTTRIDTTQYDDTTETLTSSPPPKNASEELIMGRLQEDNDNLTLILSTSLTTIFLGMIFGSLLYIMLKRKRKRNAILNAPLTKENIYQIPTYRQFHDMHLMEGSADSLGMLKTIIDPLFDEFSID